MEFRSDLVLSGRWVRLEPLTLDHAVPLARAGSDPSIWAFVRSGRPVGESGMSDHVAGLLRRRDEGCDVPYAVVLAGTGVVVGATRFLDIDRTNRSVEVGGTWYDPCFQRTPVNTEAKRLLLGRAFEEEGALRVQLKTDLRNERSQRAIERLGARREGVLRDHLVLADGFVRSSVLYSLVPSEWPGVRARLDGLLEKPWTPPTESP